MTLKSIKKIKKPIKLQIDLTGPNGNAFVLLGIASKLAKQIGRDPKPILNEMRGGNYENLLNVLEREFGNLIDLYR